MNETTKHVQLVIHGHVQGVFFRKHTRQNADALGIVGWVRNEPDGTVRVTAAGDEKSIEKFIAWCSRGPDGARVNAVDYKELPPEKFTSFEIQYF